MIPSIPTPGNHEYNRNDDGQPQLSPHWAKQFTLPRQRSRTAWPKPPTTSTIRTCVSSH